jgi:hypothetical protein
MAIGSVTSTGKQNVESGGGVYLVEMMWNVKVTSTQTLGLRVYAYTGRMINNVDDFVDYIHEKGHKQTVETAYYPCSGSMAYNQNLITSYRLIAIKNVDSTLSLDYYASWTPGYNYAEPDKLRTFSCWKL